MNKAEIRDLLDKYYDGETSEEEELKLKEFFKQQNIPDDLIREKEIFSYYGQMERVQEPSAGFESRIMAAIDEEESKAKHGRSRLLYAVSSIAAGLLILTGSYFFLTRDSGPRDTYSDPEIAYAETMKILYDVSVRINRGTKALEPVTKMQEITEKSFAAIGRPARIIEDKLEPLYKLNGVMEAIGGIEDNRK